MKTRQQTEAYNLLILFSRQLGLNNTPYNIIWEHAEKMSDPNNHYWAKINRLIEDKLTK